MTTAPASASGSARFGTPLLAFANGFPSSSTNSSTSVAKGRNRSLSSVLRGKYRVGRVVEGDVSLEDSAGEAVAGPVALAVVDVVVWVDGEAAGELLGEGAWVVVLMGLDVAVVGVVVSDVVGLGDGDVVGGGGVVVDELVALVVELFAGVVVVGGEVALDVVVVGGEVVVSVVVMLVVGETGDPLVGSADVVGSGRDVDDWPGVAEPSAVLVGGDGEPPASSVASGSAAAPGALPVDEMKNRNNAVTANRRGRFHLDGIAAAAMPFIESQVQTKITYLPGIETTYSTSVERPWKTAPDAIPVRDFDSTVPSPIVRQFRPGDG